MCQAHEISLIERIQYFHASTVEMLLHLGYIFHLPIVTVKRVRRLTDMSNNKFINI